MRHLTQSLVLSVVALLLFVEIAAAANSVSVESKDFAIAESVCVVGVYVTNDIPLTAIVMPLEARSVTGGAFWIPPDTNAGSSSQRNAVRSRILGLTPDGRIQNSPLGAGNGDWPPAFQTLNKYSDPSGAICSGPVSNTYQGAVVALDSGSSPDGFLVALISSGDPGAGDSITLQPGSDPIGVPSLWFRFKAGLRAGKFEIDTCCVRPANHLRGVDEGTFWVALQFTKGIVNVLCGDPTETDGDSIADACDNCASVPNPLQTDADNDAWGDACDNCPSTANPSQADFDNDGVGDACDNCASIANVAQTDVDQDGVGDICDNCPSTFNTAQTDSDNDGTGDACDNCPTISNASQADVDQDGVGDVCDACLTDPLNDPDGDSVCNSFDNCPAYFNPAQADSNSDNIGDACDCNCLCHNDPVCDSVKSNIVDVVGTINVAFRGAAPMADPSPGCPNETTDFDCSGSTNIVDVVKAINVAFRGANVATEYCEACP